MSLARVFRPIKRTTCTKADRMGFNALAWDLGLKVRAQNILLMYPPQLKTLEFTHMPRKRKKNSLLR